MKKFYGLSTSLATSGRCITQGREIRPGSIAVPLSLSQEGMRERSLVGISHHEDRGLKFLQFRARNAHLGNPEKVLQELEYWSGFFGKEEVPGFYYSLGDAAHESRKMGFVTSFEEVCVTINAFTGERGSFNAHLSINECGPLPSFGIRLNQVAASHTLAIQERAHGSAVCDAGRRLMHAFLQQHLPDAPERNLDDLTGRLGREFGEWLEASRASSR